MILSGSSNSACLRNAAACFAIHSLIACAGNCLAQPADPHGDAFNNQQQPPAQAPAQPQPGVPVAQTKSGPPSSPRPAPGVPSPAAPSASSVRPAVVINRPVVNVGTTTTNNITNNNVVVQQPQQQPQQQQLGDPYHPIPGQPVAQIQSKPPAPKMKPGAPSPSAPSVSSGPRTVTINNPTVNVGTKTTNNIINNNAPPPTAAPVAAQVATPTVATSPAPMPPPRSQSNFSIGFGGVLGPAVVSGAYGQPNYAQPVGQPNAVVYQPAPLFIGPAVVEPYPTATVVNNTETVIYQPGTVVAQPAMPTAEPNVTYVDVQPRVAQPTYFATNDNAGVMGWDDTPEYIVIWVLSAEPANRADAAARFLGRVPAGGWKARFESARATESGQELLFRGLRQDSQGQFVQIVVRANSAPAKLFQRQQCQITGRLSQLCVDDPTQPAGILILDDASVK